jgi:hypothetical protein
VDEVGRRVIVSTRVVAGVDLDTDPRKECVKGRVGFRAKVAGGLGRGAVVLGRQAIDLLRVEHAIGFQIRQAAFLAGIRVLALKGPVFDNGGGLLAFADLSTRLLRLAIGEPTGCAVAFSISGKPQHQHVYAGAGFTVSPEREGCTTLLAGPRLVPCGGARLKGWQ